MPLVGRGQSSCGQRPNMKIIFLSNGRAVSSAPIGSAAACMPAVATRIFRTFPWCSSPVGSIPMRARRRRISRPGHIKRGPVKLVLGPWTHGQRSVTYAGDVDFGPAATLDGNIAPDYIALRRAWFDGQARYASDQCRGDQSLRCFTLQFAGDLRRCGALWAPWRGDDVLVFQTAPLADAMEATGPVRAHLFVSSSTPDADITISAFERWLSARYGRKVVLSYNLAQAT